MKRRKIEALLILVLFISIGPANASQISGTNSTFDDSIGKIDDTQNKIQNFNRTIQDDLNSLTNEANRCKPSKIPWYIWLGAVFDFWVIVIYLAVHIDRIRSKTQNLKNKLEDMNIIGNNLNGTRYGLEAENNSANHTDSVDEYTNYMNPKIEAKSGHILKNKTGNIEVGDLVLYNSRNLYYRYLYVSSIDRKNGNYILRGMNNKKFIKSASDIDGNVKMKYNIKNAGNNTRDDDLAVVNAAYEIQKEEFFDRRSSLVTLKDTSFTLTQTTEWMRGSVTLVCDGINTAIAWLSITGLPQIITDFKDSVVFAIMMINEYIFKPLNNLSKDLISYFDLEIPDLQDYYQPFVSEYPTAYDMNFTTTNTKNLTANLNTTGSSILDYKVTCSPASGHLELCQDHGGYNSTFIYVPDPGFAGNVTFKYMVDEGSEESNEATIRIEVTCNQVPITNNFNQSIKMNEVVNGNLNARDPDGDILNYQIISGVSHGSLSIRGDGTFIYIPNQNYVGNDSFTYIANDGYLNSTKTTIKFRIDNPPIAENMEFTIPKDKTLDLTCSDFKASDVDGDKLQFNVFKSENPLNGNPNDIDGDNLDSDPKTWGNLTKKGMGWFYNPTRGFTGVVKLGYKAYDGVFWSNIANITINYQ